MDRTNDHNSRDATRHPTGVHLEEYLDGALLTGEARAVASHLEGCAHCAALVGDARAFRARLEALDLHEPSAAFAATVFEAVSPDLARRRALNEQLAALGHFAPPAHFSAAVVARVGDRRRAREASRARARARVAETLEVRAKRWFRDPRQVFAALGGVAVAPIAVLAAVISTVLSNEQLSPGALLSFARWKIAAGADAVVAFLSSFGAELPGWATAPFGLESSTSAFAAFAAVLALGTLASVFVLYRTLSTPPMTSSANGRRTP